MPRGQGIQRSPEREDLLLRELERLLHRGRARRCDDRRHLGRKLKRSKIQTGQ